jgi:hypothetical protein
MYTVVNYPTKKAFKQAFALGTPIRVYQPGGIFPGKTDGRAYLEGPHFPKPHSWYAAVDIKDGVVVKIVS